MGEEGHGEKDGARRRLGRNSDPYYGPTLDALQAEKHGTKKLSRALAAQGATTKNGRYVTLGGATTATKASKKLLGG